ncbi:hypothetical protein HHE02_13790 [Helicobacter heilmannii]|uniref:Uncharacterized protein n=1 Tax=Helicobacter heilmannii TaxID=35817 RepID=A0A0K2XL97_HELHE|nr:hypothetical protein BN341_18780 [Helicobacter heilmannii ASB1.4]CRF45083.1 hypothetical protein HHE014_00300 [Helicobacter heilmannii]CRF48071.1 hypothetical protein HHE02_13790 [Helicobacter heilmannii]CRF48610.1 hypothetical protein HHE03_01790 [Helicobacter heilmannii]CRF50925.1 hypothetical protein HHE06_07830 [Helicobacter heilmannii]
MLEVAQANIDYPENLLNALGRVQTSGFVLKLLIKTSV